MQSRRKPAAPRRRRAPIRRRKTGTRPTQSGCLIWAIPILLGVIILFANTSVIRDVEIFLNQLFSTEETQNTDPADENPQTSTPPAATAQSQPPAESAAGATAARNPDIILNLISQDQQRKSSQADTAPAQAAAESTSTKPAPAAQTTVETPPAEESAARSATLFFILYASGEDRFSLAGVQRQLPRSGAPAQSTLAALLAGPTQAELKQGYRTLIPENVRINRLVLEGGVLLVDLSSNFLNNQKFGREGMLLQIYQVVNTLTRFDTVRGVRFMFDGNIKAFGGGDGIMLDRVFSYTANPVE